MDAGQLKAGAGRSVLVLTFLLMILLVVMSLASESFNILFLFAQLVPLALTLPGLLRESSRAFQWLCFVDLFFLTQGILFMFTPDRLYFGVAETLICLALFISAIIFIRAARSAG
jgi:uncharacterized membrane protein